MLATALQTSLPIVAPLDSRGGYEHNAAREPWLMVPRTGTRTLTLNLDRGNPVKILNADDQGNIRSHMNMPVCRVRVFGNQLIIEGLRESRDIPIDLAHRGREFRVMVSVKNRKTLPIIAHYVEHGPLLKTRMTRERLREILDQANACLRQANVRLSLALESVLGPARLFPADSAATGAGSAGSAKKSLGLVVKGKEEYERLIRHRLTVPTVSHLEFPALNVFFVRKTNLGDLESAPTEVHAFTDNRGNCIFGDYTEPGRAIVGVFKEGNILAHEAVHHLMFIGGATEAHHVKSDPYNLMGQGNLKFHATRLTREQIERINPTLAFQHRT